MTSSSLRHSHSTPDHCCPPCTARFGTNAGTTAEIVAMLLSINENLDGELSVAASNIQVAWILNRHLDRIATSLEKMAAAA